MEFSKIGPPRGGEREHTGSQQNPPSCLPPNTQIDP